MAIVINSNPSSPQLVSDPVLWNLTMTGLISGTVQSRFGYQLLDSGDVAITNEEVLTPQEGVPFNVWFNQDIFNRLSTALPPLTGDVRAESEMTIQVKLKYWEQNFDTSDCSDSRSGEQETGLITVINSANQFFGRLDNEVDITPLTFVPDKMKICQENDQLFYFYNSSAIFVQVDLMNSDNTLNFRKDMTANPGANSLRISPIDIAQQKADGDPMLDLQDVLDATNHIIVKMGTNFSSQPEIFRIYFSRCCEDNSIYFQNFAGGYSILHFDEVEFRRISSKFTEINSFQVPSDYPNTSELTTKGLQIQDKENQREMTLTKVLTEDDQDHLYFYESFLSSESYFLKFDDNDGNETLVKFIPKSGSIAYDQNRDIQVLRITGRTAQEYKLPNGKI